MLKKIKATIEKNKADRDPTDPDFWLYGRLDRFPVVAKAILLVLSLLLWVVMVRIFINSLVLMYEFLIQLGVLK